jgi:CheY-like chemotaxis protein
MVAAVIAFDMEGGSLLLGKRVLVVDDEADIREMLRAVLEGIIGVQTVVAADGYEALEQARKLLPALVVLDLMMPGLDGFAVARQLKADLATRAIPIIAVTALRDERVRAIEAGCSDFMAKPIELDHFLALVRKFLSAMPEGKGD